MTQPSEHDELQGNFEDLIQRLEHSDGRVDELLKEAARAVRNLLQANEVLWNSIQNVHNSETI